MRAPCVRSAFLSCFCVRTFNLSVWNGPLTAVPGCSGDWWAPSCWQQHIVVLHRHFSLIEKWIIFNSTVCVCVRTFYSLMSFCGQPDVKATWWRTVVVKANTRTGERVTSDMFPSLLDTWLELLRSTSGSKHWDAGGEWRQGASEREDCDEWGGALVGQHCWSCQRAELTELMAFSFCLLVQTHSINVRSKPSVKTREDRTYLDLISVLSCPCSAVFLQLCSNNWRWCHIIH